MHGVVYKLSNGEKSYIGSTINLTRRISGHECPSNACSSSQLYEAGTPVTCTVLEEVEFTDRKDLFIREQSWMDRTDNCVNENAAHTTPERTRALSNQYYQDHPIKRIRARLRYQDPVIAANQCLKQREKYHRDKRKLERIREKLERMPSFIHVE